MYFWVLFVLILQELGVYLAVMLCGSFEPCSLALFPLPCCVIFHWVIAPRYSHPFPYWWTFRLLPTYCYYGQYCSRHLCAGLHMQGWSIFPDWTCGREISGPRVNGCVGFNQLLSNCSPNPFHFTSTDERVSYIPVNIWGQNSFSFLPVWKVWSGTH